MAASSTHVRTCPLCEATCGLALTVEDGRVTDVRGDPDDVFSRGYICPKGTALAALHDDPDRLRGPLVRRDGHLRPATWDEAFAAVEEGLAPVFAQHGRDAVALYVGNPSVHSLSAMTILPMLVRAFGTPNYYTAASVDQIPKHVSSGLMFGHPELIPVPDIDRTDHLVLLGANPWVSNGSLATAPDFKGRLKAIRKRGGRVVVIDPRRTETARHADEHLFIRPGTDAFLVLALARTLFDEGFVDLGDLAPHVQGAAEAEALVAPFTPEVAAERTGIPAERIRALARELAAAPSACVYDRVGVHQGEFGTLVSWGSDLVNVLTGNLDRPGGRMFPLAAHAAPDPSEPVGKGWRTGRFASRVRGHPEAYGQLPAAALADEILTPGEGQVRAVVTVAGNPVLSTPNGSKLSDALAGLDFMVAVDPYVNETTRHAHVVLPPNGPLTRSHYDYAFLPLAVRNVANFSPPLFEAEGVDEWEILARIALVAGGQPVTMDPAVVPALGLSVLVSKAVGPGGALEGRDPEEITSALGDRDPILRILDFRLRAGAYGDRFGERADGLSLSVLEANPHGIDLGPLQPRLPGALRTASGKVELAPPAIAADVERLRAAAQQPAPGLVLIARRHLRSNNSWMHNLEPMLGGTNRCTLLVHPDDAAARGITDGDLVAVTSGVGEVHAPAQVSDEVMAGVVSLPHGWGHDRDGVRLGVARSDPGVSVNDLTDDARIDPLSGNAALNGVPVTLTRVGEAAASGSADERGIAEAAAGAAPG